MAANHTVFTFCCILHCCLHWRSQLTESTLIFSDSSQWTSIWCILSLLHILKFTVNQIKLWFRMTNTISSLHWGLGKMATNLQTTCFSNIFSCMKIILLLFKFSLKFGLTWSSARTSLQGQWWPIYVVNMSCYCVNSLDFRAGKIAQALQRECSFSAQNRTN